jgi:hypothetical protein
VGQTDVGGIGFWKGQKLVAVLLSINGDPDRTDDRPPAYSLEYLISTVDLSASADADAEPQPYVRPFVDFVGLTALPLTEGPGCHKSDQPYECIGRWAEFLDAKLEDLVVYRADGILQVDEDSPYGCDLHGLPNDQAGAIVLPDSDGSGSDEEPAVLLHYLDETSSSWQLHELYFGGARNTPMFPLTMFKGIVVGTPQHSRVPPSPPLDCKDGACAVWAESLAQIVGPYTVGSFTHANVCIRELRAEQIRKEISWPQYETLDSNEPCDIRATQPTTCIFGRCSFGEFKRSEKLAEDCDD